MTGVPATPPTVFAQGDPVGVIALALVRLVVAALALLAGEGHSDPDVSASHWGDPCVVVYTSWAKKTPPKCEVVSV
jgi:hypothetical protein